MSDRSPRQEHIKPGTHMIKAQVTGPSLHMISLPIIEHVQTHDEHHDVALSTLLGWPFRVRESAASKQSIVTLSSQMSSFIFAWIYSSQKHHVYVDTSRQLALTVRRFLVSIRVTLISLKLTLMDVSSSIKTETADKTKYIACFRFYKKCSSRLYETYIS